MLSSVFRDIDIIRQRHIKKGEEIDDLIRQVQDFNNRLRSLSYKVEKGLFIQQLSKLTKNQMIIIGSFLEFKQFISLRLVNRQFRNLVQSCFPDLKIAYQDKINIIQQELDGFQNDNIILIVRQVQQRFNQLTKKNLIDALSLVNPPSVVCDVFFAVYILLVGQKNKQNLSFDDIKPKLKSQDFVQYLKDVSVYNLNTYQMSVLESLTLTYSVQYAQGISIAASYLLDILLCQRNWLNLLKLLENNKQREFNRTSKYQINIEQQISLNNIQYNSLSKTSQQSQIKNLPSFGDMIVVKKPNIKLALIIKKLNQKIYLFYFSLLF